jgi:hypothetical protein
MADRLTHDRTRGQQGEGHDRRKRGGCIGRAILLAVGALVVVAAVVRWAVTRPVVVDPPPPPPNPPEKDRPDQPARIPQVSGIVPSIGEILNTAFGDEHVTPGAGPDFVVQLGDKRIAVNVHLTLRSDSEPSIVADQAYVHAQAYFAPHRDRRPVMDGVVMVIGNTQLFELLPTHPREGMRIVPLLSSTDSDAIEAAIRELAA